MDRIPLIFRKSYEKLLTDFADVFSKSETDLGKATVVKQRVTLKDPDKITTIPPYRMAPHLKAVADEYIDKMLAAKIICKSDSPFSSPLMLVRKATKIDPNNPLKGYRVVLDYRKVNQNTVPDSYPMRHLQEMIDSISNAKVWTVLDLANGYFNQVLEPESCRISAFSLPGSGHYEFCRTPQGMRNSCASFQSLLDYVTRGLPNVAVYIDDIIISSQNHEEHQRHLRELLARLRRYNLKIKLEKVQLATNEINYLGYNLI